MTISGRHVPSDRFSADALVIRREPGDAISTPTRALVLALLSSTAVAAGPAAAGADAAAGATADTTPPSISLDVSPHYVKGSTVNTYYDDPDDPDYAYFDLEQQLRWRTSDASGICAQSVTEQSYDTLGGDDDPVLGPETSTQPLDPAARSYSFTAGTWTIRDGGVRFVVRSTDCAGNTSTSNISDVAVGFWEDTSPRVTYAGSWKVANFPGFSGGTTHATSRRGARSTTTVGGGPVALVMEKASNRGRADVLVDGVRRATVNTYSATTSHRTVVWEALLAPGQHTLEVVNKATAGHPRIDLDMVLARRPAS